MFILAVWTSRDLRFRQQRVWRDAAGLDPQVVNRKVVSYLTLCGCPLVTTGGASYSFILVPFCLFLAEVSRPPTHCYHYQIQRPSGRYVPTAACRMPRSHTEIRPQPFLGLLSAHHRLRGKCLPKPRLALKRKKKKTYEGGAPLPTSIKEKGEH